MGAPALKYPVTVREMSGEFPFPNILTRVLIESLCPLLQSEVIFGKIDRSKADEQASFWIDAEIQGDLEGRLGLAADASTLRGLATHLRMPDPKAVLIFIHENLAKVMEQRFADEDFRCDFRRGSGYRENQSLEFGSEPAFVFPVGTGWGTVRVYLWLRAINPDLQGEISTNSRVVETRKIRVYSSQLEILFGGIKALESLESKLLQGPQVRSQMRSQIKRLKRMMHQLKTESLDTLFSPAKRVVAELSKQQGKQIRFESNGTWLCLDKNLLNFLYEPVLHLVRNAVDHGIELPLERERVGKNAVGTVKAIATFNQGMLRMLLTDDGKGLDFGLIRERAVSKGLCTAEDSSRKSKEELAEFIFAPGFSTRKVADSISGRGLGLDIVRKSLEAVGGTFRLVSTTVHGTSLEMLIPLTDEFSARTLVLSPASPRNNEEEERAQILEELWTSFDRLAKSLIALEEERGTRSAYEGYRVVHSIKGACGYLGWNRVANFCHHYEDLLKLLAEEKSPIDDAIVTIVLDAGEKLKEFCKAAWERGTYSLYEIRRLESRLLQVIWAATRNDEKTHLFLGKYHLNAVENYLLPLAENGSFSVRPEADFSKAVGLPYGTLIQFNGDRRGFAGIFLTDKTVSQVIYPLISGSQETQNPKRQLWSLTEFANMMGMQFAEACARVGITLQPSAPLTFYGWGQPLRILGNPTYCYACEINGFPFYLAGDFRVPQETLDQLPQTEPSYAPGLVIDEAKRQVEKTLSAIGMQTLFSEAQTQSDLIGFDGGITSIISCSSPDKSTPDSVLFLSFESYLAQHIYEQLNAKPGPTPDLYDCLNEMSANLGNLIISELEKQRVNLKLSPPTVFLGKAYVANFNRLFVTNKVVCNTEKGRLELQILVTELAD